MSTDYTVAAPPRITRQLFADALLHRASPAAPLSDELYSVCERWGVDPAVALAFFVHESHAGTKGAALLTRNWGNLRKGPAQMRAGHTGVSGTFAFYASWVVSLSDFCKLLRGPTYEQRGRTTVSKIVPVYAPAKDRNTPATYIQAVNGWVALWERLSRPRRGETEA